MAQNKAAGKWRNNIKFHLGIKSRAQWRRYPLARASIRTSLILTDAKKSSQDVARRLLDGLGTSALGIRAQICAIGGDHLCLPALLPSAVSMGTKWTLCSAHAP